MTIPVKFPMKALACSIPLALAACVTTPTGPGGTAEARIGQTAFYGDIGITPVVVTEDSRCPTDATCTWEGRVVVTTRITGLSGSQSYEMILDEPKSVSGGTITLTEVTPEAKQGQTIALSDYRFYYSYERY